MTIRPAVPDPPEITAFLWDGFGGGWGGTPTGYAWDVGANAGQSVATMRMLFAKITSFEPCQDSYDLFRKMFPDNQIFRYALTDHGGDLELALPDGEQAETGQLVTPGTRGMEWSVKDWSVVPRVTVPCVTADHMARELGLPDFIKVDTEGHECQVLSGAQEILDTGTTDWLIEFHSEANYQWCAGELKDHGLRVDVIHHPHYRESTRLWKNHGWLRGFAK